MTIFESEEKVPPSVIVERLRSILGGDVINFLESPTVGNQVAVEDTLRAYRDAWIRSKS